MSLLCANFFSTVLYIIIAIFVLLLMVLIHEFGHYVVGRLLGFKINEFSIGFGKAIFSKVNKRGERISLRIFPLGGYCAFEGEGDDEDDSKDQKKDSNENIEEKKEEAFDLKVSNEKAEEIIQEIENIEKDKETTPVRDYKTFNEQKPWKRLLVYAAGVTFNFLSAIIFSFILLIAFGYDIPQAVKVNPTTIQENTIIMYAQEGYELREDDVIWKVNGTKINFAFTGTLPQLISEIGPEKDITLTVERDNKQIDMVIQFTVYEEGQTIADVDNAYTAKAYVHSFWEALGRSFEVAFGFAWVILKGFWQIITGQIAFSELGGPISTIGMITTITQSGLVNFFILLPLLASNLAIFNFLPIPALDGSHAVFTLLEWIFRKPVVSRKVENYIHTYGLLALLLLVVVADIVHIIVVGFPKL